MSKINLIGSKSLFIKFIVIVLILTLISVGAISSLFSFVFLKLDLDLSLLKYASIAIDGICAIFISFFSVKSFSNNGAVLGIISVVPIIIFSIINELVFSNDWIVLIAKILIMLVLSAVFGNYSIKKRKKFRVK